MYNKYAAKTYTLDYCVLRMANHDDGEVTALGKQRESAEIVKNRILKVATELFAQHGVDGVGIRRIAAEAGINHALIIRYFGSKDNLVSEILQREISKLTTSYPVKHADNPAQTLANLRSILLYTLSADRDTMKLIVRFGLDGLPQEAYLNGANDRAANLIARWIASQQAKRDDPSLPDARLVSLIVVGALFSSVSIGPWLLSSVGLPQEEFAERIADIVDVAIWMIARAIGLPPEACAAAVAEPLAFAPAQPQPEDGTAFAATDCKRKPR